MAERLSPLAELALPGEYGALTATPGVTLSEDICTALVQVACWPETLDACKVAIGKALESEIADGRSVSRAKECSIMPTGPGRWLIESDNEKLETTLRKALKPEVASVTNLTHARIRVTVKGEQADWLLASGIALDFHINSFPVSMVQVSHHHEVGLTIHRTAEDCFELYLFTSFARSFWQWLSDAAAEIGYRVN
ncbi:sarcosine oxidase subunit gamma [Pseudahrensia aquimaris]|uniref:Sarcosine oxidase subunit gamma n=1 Tax=Pseudahrensia aquimaris TaxID=744461 RepID=A0ABW3FHC9_9HYPH